MQNFPWLTTLIVAPLVGAAIVWLLPKSLSRYIRHVAVAVSIVVLGIAVAMAFGFDTSDAGSQQFTQVASWIPAFGASWALGVNGVGLVLILLSVILVPISLLAAWKDVPEDQARRIKTYLGLILVLEAFMIAVFAARDVFLFYVLFEAMLIPVYFLIGGFGGANRRYAAVKFLLYSLAGGLIMLAAVIGLYVQGKNAGIDPHSIFLIDNLTGLDMATSTERLLFIGFFTAFAIKAPMFPVHTWLPDAAQNSTPATATLLVGVLDKVGTFGMIALCLPLFPNASKWAAPAIIVLALISIIYGGLLAIGQKDMMRLVAYTSVSHFGFIVLGIFAFSETAQTGSSLYMLNHGFSTAALFLVVGMIMRRRGGSAQIDDFGGLQKIAPLLAGSFLIAGLSALSLPGLSTFVSEFLVIVGTFQTNQAAAIIAVFGVVLAALYVLLTYQKVAAGPVTDELKEAKDLSGREKWVVAPLIALLLVLGFYPKPALDVIEPASQVTVATVASASQEGGVQ